MTNGSEKPMPEDKNLAFWNALYAILQDASRRLPHADQPDRIYWDHPDEGWKNDAELGTIEKEFWDATNELIIHFCDNHEWPKRSKNNARYFAEQRLKWGIKFLRLFTIPVSSTGAAAIPRPSQNGWQLLKWLLIEVYAKRNPASSSVPFTISGSDGMTTIYT